MRHIKKITLLTLLSLSIASLPAQGMNYISSAWNTAKNLSPIASAGSLLNKIPGVQSVVNGASRIFGGASNIVSSYAHNEAGSFSDYNINITDHVTRAIVYGFRNPTCKLLSQLTRNKLSPDFFNKLITATTTPIALVVHAYCLYHMISTVPLWDFGHIWNAWLLYRNLQLLMKDAAALLSLNSLTLPPELPRRDWENTMGSILLAISMLPDRVLYTHIYPPNFIAMLMNAVSYSTTNNYYRSVGIHSGYAIIKDKINQGIRKFKRFFWRRQNQQDVRIDSLGDHTQCLICLENFAANEAGSRLACNHHYHADCINQWLDNNALNPTCPTCRALAPDNTITPIIFK